MWFCYWGFPLQQVDTESNLTSQESWLDNADLIESNIFNIQLSYERRQIIYSAEPWWCSDCPTAGWPEFRSWHELWEVNIHSFFILILDGVQWLALCYGRFSRLGAVMKHIAIWYSFISPNYSYVVWGNFLVSHNGTYWKWFLGV